MAIGWKYGTKYASLPISGMPGISAQWEEDEYFGVASGGNSLYWNKQEARHTAGANISTPNQTFLNFPNDPNFPTGYTSRQDRYIPPEYPSAQESRVKYLWQPPNQIIDNKHLFFDHTTSGPITYNGKVYINSGGVIAAFGPTAGNPLIKTIAVNPGGNAQSAATLSTAELKSRLEAQITKLVTKDGNGNYIHYKPGYAHTGLFDNDTFAVNNGIFENLLDYWRNPADTITILTAAIPHVNPTLQTELKNYIKSEYANFSPATYASIGWAEGQFRQSYDWPSAMITNIQSIPKTTTIQAQYYNYPPQNIYAVWKYVAAGLCTSPCTAGNQFSIIQNKLPSTIPHDVAFLNASRPHVLNTYIAGYKGYVELAKLAGQPSAVWQPYQNQLDTLLTARKNQFQTVLLHASTGDFARYFFVMHQSYNFMNMTPELADYLHDNSLALMQQTVNIYTNKASSPPIGTNDGPRTPYWLQAHNVEVQGEDGISPYQQTHSIFQAKARVIQESQLELSKYVDSPIMQVGDLYYIDNLVAALDAPGGGGTGTPTPTPGVPGDADGDGDVDGVDYNTWLTHYNQVTGNGPSDGDFNGNGTVDGVDYNVWLNNYGT